MAELEIRISERSALSSRASTKTIEKKMIKKTLFVYKMLINATVFNCIGMLLFTQAVIADPVVIDHNTTDITQIPEAAIEQAKSTLHIAYGHTSHGSQLTTGMTGLVDFANNGGLGLDLPQDLFAWNNGGLDGALDLEEGDGYGDGWLDHDAGYYPQWVDETRAYLDDSSHSDTNVIIWSWCGQLSSYTEQELIDQYFTPMLQLETDYPNVTFVYMTGHADGSGETGNLHLRNQQIRTYCINNDKVLYDFYDIECYDPDGNYFGDKWVDDACNYDSDGDGTADGNWATEWQITHVEGADWYDCRSAHSRPLNANRKAYAAWWLWATLAGWSSDSEDNVDLCPDDPEKTSPGVCGCGVADTDSDNDGFMDCEDLCPDDPEKNIPWHLWMWCLLTRIVTMMDLWTARIFVRMILTKFSQAIVAVGTQKIHVIHRLMNNPQCIHYPMVQQLPVVFILPEVLF